MQADPLFCGYNQVTTIGIVLITSNRGMAGAYNQNVIERALQDAASGTIPMRSLSPSGARAVTPCSERGSTIHADFSNLTDATEVSGMSPVARVVLDGFRDQVFGQVKIAYTPFQQGKLATAGRAPVACPSARTRRPRSGNIFTSRRPASSW